MMDLFGKHRLLTWAGVLWILVQLPFVSGPFRVDDPYHLRAAQQMLKAPGDPYGFHINWSGTPEWAFHDIRKSAPGSRRG